MFRTSDARSGDYFRKRGLEVNIHRSEFAGQPVRFLETVDRQQAADTALPIILFVHGAPGSADNFYRYLTDSALLARARLITVDRLGYGYSAYGVPSSDLRDQAALLHFVIQRYQSPKVILVGHSYGGPVVAKCAMDYPDLVSGLLLLAPVHDPDHERIFWFAHFARWQATRWMLSAPLRVAGAEKFSHAKELASIAEGWANLRIPIVHIHGQKDFLAPPENIEFSRRRLPADFLKLIVLDKGGHFIPWSNYDLVRQELFQLLDTAPELTQH